jgi:hypothetical protein
MKWSLALLLAASAAAAPANPTIPAINPALEASIDYSGPGAVRDWYARDERQIFLRDRVGRWYTASFAGVCPNLLTTDSITFIADGSGRLDRFGSLDTGTQRCQFHSLVRSAAPPEKGK